MPLEGIFRAFESYLILFLGGDRQDVRNGFLRQLTDFLKKSHTTIGTFSKT